MKAFRGHVIGLLSFLFLIQTAPVLAQTRESTVVDTATMVLDEIMATRLSEIPASLLADAEGVAVVPDVVKVGFIAGVRRGRGVLLVKDDVGAWTPPRFITLTGGSFGWQIGLQATDVILVFKTRKSIRGLMDGTLTLGADAAVAAGPIGRNAAAATDAGLKAEIYTFARSRGLFAGVSLDGTMLEIDQMAASRYYSTVGPALGGGMPLESPAIPESATRLMGRLAAYCGPGPMGGSVAGGGSQQPAFAAQSEESVRRELAARSMELYGILDAGWKAYLALPAELFEGNASPTLAALNVSLSRFDTVAVEPSYQTLTQRREFQATHQLLRQYAQLQAPKVGTRLELPPPPAGSPSQRR
ncbi:MAG: lipid-binding SYLF domain-containing protein [Planctomycetes bacterium]|nr:lipid-binding SYLF domain-containing protein [Planctomycetota bacterium]